MVGSNSEIFTNPRESSVTAVWLLVEVFSRGVGVVGLIESMYAAFCCCFSFVGVQEQEKININQNRNNALRLINIKVFPI